MQGGYFKNKKVYIFVNGRNEYMPFNIHPKCRQGWNAILDQFSNALKPYFGAIRTLRSIDGKRIIDNFDKLEHEQKYVACGFEPFKEVRGGYFRYSELNVREKPQEYYPAQLLSETDQKKYPCLIETMRKGRTIIYIFANGKKMPPKKLVLIKSDFEAWENILNHISIILDIPEGIKGMCTVFGQPLCSPYEIQHGGYYVAIPFNASYKQIKYLPVHKIKSYQENSPLITKEIYVSASKTCPSIVSRIKSKIKTKKLYERSRKKSGESDEDETISSLRVEGVSFSELKGSRPKPKRKIVKKHVTNFFPKPIDVSYGDTSQKGISSTNSDNLSQDISPEQTTDEETRTSSEEGIVRKTSYDFIDITTQTSSIFHQAIYDRENAIFLNNKRYYLIPEEEMEKLRIQDRNWFTGDYTLATNGIPDKDKQEIRKLASTLLGAIISQSEKIVNEQIFGLISADKEPSPIETVKRAVVEEPKEATHGQTVTKKSALVKDKSNFLRERSLRLSISVRAGSSYELLPIGRAYVSSSSEHAYPKSTDGEKSDIELEKILNKEFRPLTPVVGEKKRSSNTTYPKRESFDEAISSITDMKSNESVNDSDETDENSDDYLKEFLTSSVDIGVEDEYKRTGKHHESVSNESCSYTRGKKGPNKLSNDDSRNNEKEDDEENETELKSSDIGLKSRSSLGGLERKISKTYQKSHSTERLVPDGSLNDNNNSVGEATQKKSTKNLRAHVSVRSDSPEASSLGTNENGEIVSQSKNSIKKKSLDVDEELYSVDSIPDNVDNVLYSMESLYYHPIDSVSNYYYASASGNFPDKFNNEKNEEERRKSLLEFLKRKLESELDNQLMKLYK